MSLEALLEAAKILQDREHGTLYSAPVKMKERKAPRRSQTYRRAHLRDCLTSLRDLVPTPPDQTKATTLSLLQSAKQYIKTKIELLFPRAVQTGPKVCDLGRKGSVLPGVAIAICHVLEVHDREAQLIKRKLCGEQEKLRRKLSDLVTGSSCEEEETPSKVPRMMETEEIDVENDDETGYGSGDDRSSTDSSGSH
eukprot:gene5208-5862_t